MLTFRGTNIVFAGLVVLLLVMDVFYDLPLWPYAACAIVYSLILFYGSYYVGSNFFLNVICSAPINEKKIAISFDDGPANDYTPSILEILKQYNVPAAFFCIGKRIAGNETLINNIHNQGHIIGNHSYSHHFWFDLFPAKKMLDDLKQMDTALEQCVSLKPRFFRPPYGVTTPGMKKAVAEGNYIPVGWNIRSLDTVITDNNKLFKKVTGALRPGAILLFHDTSRSTLETLPLIIEEALNKGYEFVRLDKLINKEAYA